MRRKSTFRDADDRSTDYRKKVVHVYLALRFLFVSTSLLALILLDQSVLRLDGLDSSVLGLLWKSFVVFSGWSLVLISFAFVADIQGQLKFLDKMILVSLIPDAFAIYFSAEATGGAASPLFHSVYFLIAIHSYHLAVPVEGQYEQDRSSLKWRYLGFGVAPSVLVSIIVYSRLAGARPMALQFWIELGLQSVTAMSFAWLGLEDDERSYALARKEKELEVNQAELEVNSQHLDSTRDQLTEAIGSLERAKDDQRRMLQALGRVSNIAEMKDGQSLLSGLRDLAEQIGRTLEAEYCAVGLADEVTVEDVALWTSFPRSERVDYLLERSRVNSAEGSFIGSVIARRLPLLWDRSVDGDPLDPANPRLIEEGFRMNAEAAAGYREILPSGEVRHMLLVPFYSPHEATRSVGYVHLINRRVSVASGVDEGFIKPHADSLEVIAGQLAIAIENFRNHQRELQEREDDTFLSKLAYEHDGIDPFEEILDFLNHKIGSRVASLWLPIEDGYGSSEEVRKLVLHTVRVFGAEGRSGNDEILESELRRRGLQLHSESYIGGYLDKLGHQEPVHYQPDLSGHIHCWSDMLEKIGTPRLLLLAISDPLAPRERVVSPADKFLAVLCLRPLSEDFQLTEDVNDRLKRFAHQIENLILEKRLKRRFEQIRHLQDGLQHLQVDDLREFYLRLVKLVQKVMGAEACSLFLRERSPTQLMLKASTAEKAKVKVSGIEKVVKVANYVDQPIFSTSDRSLTVETLLRKQPVLVFNTYDHPSMSRRFCEVTETANHRSYLGAPLITGQGEVLGVLRCINQQEVHRLLPSFLHSELNFFSLLGGVVTRFIEGAQSGGAKRKFLREIAHEFTTPLLQAQTNTSFIDRYLRGSQRTKDPLEVVANLRDTLSHLRAMMKDIQFQLERSQIDDVSYDMSSVVDLHALVEQIRKPMIPVARQSKAIEVRGKTAGAPSLRLDRGRFGQVLYNVIQNAVKYSRYGGRDIYIEYDLYVEKIDGVDDSNWHRIRVSNYGIGVPEGEEELIFREHVRGSNAQFVSAGQSGTGLGLSVSRQIVERHGGFLRLERRDDPTVFSILLPQSLAERSVAL